jgi:hypothetical protein
MPELLDYTLHRGTLFVAGRVAVEPGKFGAPHRAVSLSVYCRARFTPVLLADRGRSKGEA